MIPLWLDSETATEKNAYCVNCILESDGRENYGKSVELFLVNGSAEGMMIAELSNWNGKAMKILRSEVVECDREDFQGAGRCRTD